MSAWRQIEMEPALVKEPTTDARRRNHLGSTWAGVFTFIGAWPDESDPLQMEVQLCASRLFSALFTGTWMTSVGDTSIFSVLMQLQSTVNSIVVPSEPKIFTRHARRFAFRFGGRNLTPAYGSAEGVPGTSKPAIQYIE